MYNDLAAFNSMAGYPPVAVSFDDIVPGTNITGNEINGVKLDLYGASAPLIVVKAADTYTPSGYSAVKDASTNKLIATTGENVLSPGGAELAPGNNPSVENDDLVLTFAEPVKSVAFDILYQSLDSHTFTTISVFNSSGTRIYHGGVPGNGKSGGSPAGVVSAGFVSDTSDIAKVIVNEFDATADYPDANIGFDSIRFHYTPEDVTPPTVHDISVDTPVLWSPNFKLTPVTVTIVAEDESGDVFVELLSVTSSDPDSGTYGADRENDIQDATIGTDDREVLLRAERNPKGNARVYTITFRISDIYGNSTIESVTVTVPLNQKK
jgi:hypothetical protein